MEHRVGPNQISDSISMVGKTTVCNNDTTGSWLDLL